jgi:hypothetical protein
MFLKEVSRKQHIQDLCNNQKHFNTYKYKLNFHTYFSFNWRFSNLEISSWDTNTHKLWAVK